MKKTQIFRFLIIASIIIINLILQPIIFSHLKLNGVVPNIFIITIVSFALLRGKTEGLVVGLVIGLYQDILYGSVVGFYGIIYMLIGYFTGFLYRNFYRESLLIPITVIGITDLIQNFLNYFFTFLFRGRLGFYYYARQILFPEILYTVFVGFFMYKLYYIINNYVELKEGLKENDI